MDLLLRRPHRGDDRRVTYRIAAMIAASLTIRG